MPSNEDFNLQILVGPSVLPEYQHDGQVYVESNLFTPYSYKQQGQQLVSGVVEAQKWPVTPFMISIEAKPNTPPCYYRVSIDGQKVKGISLYRCEKRVIKGFKDGTVVREFLFSLPRFAEDLDDRIDITCRHKVGMIEVECYNARKRQSTKRLMAQSLEFEQANKKDSSAVTEGRYLMTTTKAGRVIHSRSALKTTDFWDISSLRSKLTVKYVTKETLQDMGLVVIPIPFPITTRNFPGSGSRVKCELLEGGKVVLDLTGEIPGCSSSAPRVKMETDSSLNENDNNSNATPATRIQEFSLPAEMNNAMIDLTEDEELQNSEIVDNVAENTDKGAGEEAMEISHNEENSSAKDKDGEGSGNEELQTERAAKKRKIIHETAGKESEDSIAVGMRIDDIINLPAQNVLAQIDSIVAQLVKDISTENVTETSSGTALEFENVPEEDNEDDSDNNDQIEKTERGNENKKEQKDTDTESLDHTDDRLLEDSESGDSPDNDHIKETECANEIDKETKNTDGDENLENTVDKYVRDSETGGSLDNENDQINETESVKENDNEKKNNDDENLEHTINKPLEESEIGISPNNDGGQIKETESCTENNKEQNDTDGENIEIDKLLEDSEIGGSANNDANQIKETESSIENDKAQKDTDGEDIEIDKLLEDSENEGSPDNDSGNNEINKETESSTENAKAQKDTDGENLDDTIDKLLEDIGDVGDAPDNDSGNDNQSDKQGEKDHDNDLVSGIAEDKENNR